MKIGFIGLGIMGESMCENIVKKHDDDVFVFDFNEAQVDKLVGVGAKKCANSTEVAQNADVIISMVPKSEHSKAVYDEVAKVTDASKICIDMSTIDPSVSAEISKMVKATGAQFADAPVVKSKPAAIAGKLGIFVGCDEDLYDKIVPILSYMGENIKRLGGNGAGLVMKICHNALVSQIQNGVNEMLVLAGKNGIDIPTFAECVSFGGGQNFYLDSKKDALAAEDYTTAFSVQNEYKDIGICLNLAKECGVKVPGEENAMKVYEAAMEAGYGPEDWIATYKVVRDL